LNSFLFFFLPFLTDLKRSLNWKSRRSLLLFFKYGTGYARVIDLVDNCLRNFKSATFPLVIFRVNKNRLPSWFWLLLFILFLLVLYSSHFGKSNDKRVTWVYFLDFFDFNILSTVLLSLSKRIKLFLIDLRFNQILLLSLWIILIFWQRLKCLSIVNI